MSLRFMETLEFREGHEVLNPPEEDKYVKVFVYKEGSVVAQALYGKICRCENLREITSQNTSEEMLEVLEELGYLIEKVPRKDEYKQALVLYEEQVTEYLFGDIYDYLCGPEMLGIVQSDLVHTLFTLAVNKGKREFRVNQHNYFLPSVGKIFSDHCFSMREEMKALAGCYESAFHGREHFFGVSFGYHDVRGFEEGQEDLLERMHYYQLEDHPKIAKLMLDVIFVFNEKNEGEHALVKDEILMLAEPELDDDWRIKFETMVGKGKVNGRL